MNNKKINLEKIKIYDDFLNKDVEFKISQNALIKNNLKDVLKNIKIVNKLNDNFSCNAKIDSTKITDQKNSGRCWIFATLNMIRDHMVKKYNMENFEFSQSYIDFYDKLEKSNFFLNKMIQLKDKELDDRNIQILLDNPAGDGGYFEMAANLIQKYGLVPISEMPDSFASKNTTYYNKLIDIKLKQATIEIRNTKDEIECMKIKDETLKKVFEILVYFYGEPPVSFDVELKDKDKKEKIRIWRDLTPIKFFKKIDFNLSDFVSVTCTPYKKIKKNQMYSIKNTNYMYEKNNLSFLSVDKTTFKLLIISMLANKKSLWFGCDVNHFFNIKDGVWDTELYDYKNFFNLNFYEDLSKLIEYRHIAGNHAMVFQGFDYDEEKWKKAKKAFFSKNKTINLNDFDKLIQQLEIKKWNVENSWGDKNGNKGMFVISNNWFEKYVYEIIISKNNLKEYLNEPTILTKKEYSSFKAKNKKEKTDFFYEKYLNMGLNTKPIELERWDPFNKKREGK